MSGNVWEWQANYFSDSQQYPALRGGSWYDDRVSARVRSRYIYNPRSRLNYLGFRVRASASKTMFHTLD